MEGYGVRFEFSTEDELRAFIQKEFGENCYHIVASLEKINEPAPALPQAFGEWGRVFNAKKELRWWKRRGKFMALLLSEDKPAQKAEEFEVKEERVYLWGKNGDGKGEWWETRIPRKFKYPVTEQFKEVQLVGRRYFRNGIACYFRLMEVQGK